MLMRSGVSRTTYSRPVGLFVSGSSCNTAHYLLPVRDINIETCLTFCINWCTKHQVMYRSKINIFQKTSPCHELFSWSCTLIMIISREMKHLSCALIIYEMKSLNPGGQSVGCLWHFLEIIFVVCQCSCQIFGRRDGAGLEAGGWATFSSDYGVT